MDREHQFGKGGARSDGIAIGQSRLWAEIKDLSNGGGGGPSSLKFLPGVCLGGGVYIFLYIFWRGGSGQPGNPETLLWLHPC